MSAAPSGQPSPSGPCCAVEALIHLLISLIPASALMGPQGNPLRRRIGNFGQATGADLAFLFNTRHCVVMLAKTGRVTLSVRDRVHQDVDVRSRGSSPSKSRPHQRGKRGSSAVRADVGTPLCSSDRWEDRVERRPPYARSFQDLARPGFGISSRRQRRGPDRSAVAIGCARCRFRNGGRLPLVFRKTTVRAQAEQHGAWSRSGSGIIVSGGRLQRFLPLGPIDVVLIVNVFLVGGLLSRGFLSPSA